MKTIALLLGLVASRVAVRRAVVRSDIMLIVAFTWSVYYSVVGVLWDDVMPRRKRRRLLDTFFGRVPLKTRKLDTPRARFAPWGFREQHRREAWR